jgi:hypothetical protein
MGGTIQGERDEYRQKADACRKLAAEARDPGARAIYDDMARAWQEMADQVGRYEM